MITVRRSQDRGHADLGWLDTYHTFSFGTYQDPRFMGFRHLRVINEDRVQPGTGFGTHPHQDMEIITYLLDGALRHQDSTGVASVLRAGDVQRMTAGTGVTHSEMNASDEEPVHLLQIWLLPERRGLEPGYQEKHFPAEEKRGQLRLLASRDGAAGSLTVHQDVRVYAGLLEPGQALSQELAPQRHAWIQVAGGELLVNGKTLRQGDGASVSGEDALDLEGVQSAELLLFDLA